MSEQKKVSVPRAVKSQQTREQIYQAALSLLHEYGYQYITINNICKVANVSTGTFYHYFESKDALMSNFFVEAYRAFLKDREQSCEDPVDDIIQYFCYYSSFCQQQGLDFVRNFYMPFNHSMNMRRGVSEEGGTVPGFANTAAKIRTAIEMGLVQENVDADQLAEDLCIIEKGCIYEWCISDGSFEVRALTERLLKNYLRAYRK